MTDGLLIAMTLKGLPEEYKPFVVVVTQSDKEQKFSEFKVALRSFEDTERTSVTAGSHSVMKTEHKKESQSEIVCYQCGHPGDIARFCKSNNKNRRGTGVKRAIVHLTVTEHVDAKGKIRLIK